MEAYVERAPMPELAGVVRTVWIQRIGSDAYVQRHLPTGGVELHFPIGGRPRLLGPLTGPQLEVIPANTTLVGVRFHPGTPPLLPAELGDLVDQSVGLDELWGGPMEGLVEAVGRAGTPERALVIVQAHLLAQFRATDRIDRLIGEAVLVLMPWHPVEVGTLATHLALSTSQLRRRCLTAVGVSPKVLQRTLRFQGFLALAQAGVTPTGRRGRGRHGRAGDRRRLRRPGPPQPRMPTPDRADSQPAPWRHSRPVRLRPRTLRVLPALPGHAGPAAAADLTCTIRSRTRRSCGPTVVCVSVPAEFASLDGEVFTPDSPGYDAVRFPIDVAYRHVRPRFVVRCRSVSDVIRVLAYATGNGERVVPRGGGHGFAGRSATDGIVLDLSGLNSITLNDDGIATIGAGCRLGEVYAALHVHSRTLPGGCGPTVGIAGLTLGGGIGLLGRRHGLTCDRLVGAQVVLADASVIECDDHHEPDLFWALRGCGGGQFGVVTSLRFDTISEPMTTRIEAHWSGACVGDVVAAWQAWGPDAPDDITANLTLVAEPGAPVRASLFGAALAEAPTRDMLREFGAQAGTFTAQLQAGLSYHDLKRTFADPLDATGRARRARSEFFSRPIADSTLASLLAGFGPDAADGRRELAFTAMGGAYNRVAAGATAFAHRGERFLLQHIGPADDPWVDRSWATAHTDGSGRVYPNFPDLALDDWAVAYHGSNLARLAAIKRTYDPHRLLDFPQAV